MLAFFFDALLDLLQCFRFPFLHIFLRLLADLLHSRAVLLRNVLRCFVEDLKRPIVRLQSRETFLLRLLRVLLRVQRDHCRQQIGFNEPHDFVVEPLRCSFFGRIWGWGEGCLWVRRHQGSIQENDSKRNLHPPEKTSYVRCFAGHRIARRKIVLRTLTCPRQTICLPAGRFEMREHRLKKNFSKRSSYADVPRTLTAPPSATRNDRTGVGKEPLDTKTAPRFSTRGPAEECARRVVQRGALNVSRRCVLRCFCHSE